MIDLSVTIIGRNESTTLGRALRSVSGLAREIIFVDTGSIDDTVQIARENGARIFHFKWRDDFAAARNAALEQARFTWVLAIDCDEEFMREDADIHALKTACATPEANAFVVEIENQRLGGPPITHGSIRLFRNNPLIRFRNPVHESVSESIYATWPLQPIATAGFRLRHHGYARADNSDKAARNERILRKWLDREPLNIYASFKYGLSLARRRDIGAVEWLGRGFELLDRRPDRVSFPFRHDLAAAFIDELRRGGLIDEAERAKRRAEYW